MTVIIRFVEAAEATQSPRATLGVLLNPSKAVQSLNICIFYKDPHIGSILSKI